MYAHPAVLVANRVKDPGGIPAVPGAGSGASFAHPLSPALPHQCRAWLSTRRASGRRRRFEPFEAPRADHPQSHRPC
jgi:hypothetical protein